MKIIQCNLLEQKQAYRRTFLEPFRESLYAIQMRYSLPDHIHPFYILHHVFATQPSLSHSISGRYKLMFPGYRRAKRHCFGRPALGFSISNQMLPGHGKLARVKTLSRCGYLVGHHRHFLYRHLPQTQYRVKRTGILSSRY